MLASSGVVVVANFVFMQNGGLVIASSQNCGLIVVRLKYGGRIVMQNGGPIVANCYIFVSSLILNLASRSPHMEEKFLSAFGVSGALQKILTW